MRSIRKAAPSQAYFNLINYTPYPYQQNIHASWALYRNAIIGRQSGKSEVAAVEASFEVMTAYGTTGWVVAPTYEQASIVFERVSEYVKRADACLPGKRKMRVSNRNMRIIVEHYDAHGNFLGTTKFQGKSAENEDNLRGASLSYLIIDEAAMINETVWQAALAPTLTTTNGWVLIITTPKGFNWVHTFYQMGVELEGTPKYPNFTRYASWQIPTWEANPTVPEEFFVQQRKVLPERVFLQEFGAQFLSDSGSVFQRLSEVPTRPLLFEEGELKVYERHNRLHSYVIGADFARLDDFSVFTVVNAHTKKVAAVMRINTVSWERQLEHLKNLYARYANGFVVADGQGVGDVLTEQLAAMGLPLEVVAWKSSSIKEACINKLAMSIEHARITLPDDKEYLDEFAQFIYEKTPSGALKMKAAGRGKDDRVASLAMAWMFVEEHSLFEAESPEDGYAVELDFDSFDAVDALQHLF